VEKKIWLILRHGTRYPGKKYMPHMIDDLPELQHVILKNYANGVINMSADDVALFRKWKLSFAQGSAMKLAVEGENEMIDLGERYQARFPILMPEAFNNQTYKVCTAKYSNILDTHFMSLNHQLNFSLDSQPHNVQKRVQDTLQLVYLVGIIAKMFGIHCQYTKIE
jgi:hypothetical protein